MPPRDASPPAPPLDANKALACHWLELVSRHDVEAICALTSPTWTMIGGPPTLPPGPDGVRALFGSMGPIEQTWTIEDVIAEGDRVVVRATNRCVQDTFFGIPAAGRTQTFAATFTFRIADGKVQATWRNADDLGRVLQLGARLVPP
jgi:ketosteroid isomerase-like protein